MTHNARPKSWKEFQDLFCKEFLSKNEKQKNWNTWDSCCTVGHTLTQYISKYREAILKLEGLDEFQKLRGFLQGLDADYRFHETHRIQSHSKMQ